MTKFTPYEGQFNRKCDFIVEYQYIEHQDDYQTALKQGMRPDFCYEEEYGILNRMIWPEFEDKNGHIILDTDMQIQNTGRARMWIMLEEEREKHEKLLNVGKKAFLVNGHHKIAKLVVISISEKLQ